MFDAAHCRPAMPRPLHFCPIRWRMTQNVYWLAEFALRPPFGRDNKRVAQDRHRMMRASPPRAGYVDNKRLTGSAARRVRETWHVEQADRHCETYPAQRTLQEFHQHAGPYLAARAT